MSNLTDQEWSEFETTLQILESLANHDARRLYLLVTGWTHRGFGAYDKLPFQVFNIDCESMLVSIVHHRNLFSDIQELREDVKRCGR